ncbi:MAG: C10 family peptidase [Solirubrobacterales bacterium]
MGTHHFSHIRFTVSVSLVLLLVAASDLAARVTTSQEAQQAVTGWLADDAEPFGLQLGNPVGVETFTGNDGAPVYYLVRLSPTGFVIASADDLVEPIVAFADAGDYEPSDEDPLSALVAADMGQRVATAYDSPSGQLQIQSLTAAQSKWRTLINRASHAPGEITVLGHTSVSDVRVPALLKTRWSQSSVCLDYCYNYYTPNHYFSGCVATAMAQLMYYHRYPAVGIGRRSFTIGVAGGDQTAYTRGGDGSGGPYPWDDMVLSPGCGTTAKQRQAIGALCYDAGLAVRMDYAASASYADAFAVADGLMETFRFRNAVNGANSGKEIGTGLVGMINPNLDAELPVLLTITGNSGHAIVADGYGYDLSTKVRTLYHHLNMGWAGASDLWYNLPDVGSYDTVVACVYNIFPEGQGEIVSGRVVDASDRPLADVAIRATLQTAVYEATTNDRGIYALVELPANSTFTIGVSKPGFTFSSRTVATGQSRDWKAMSGNQWGVDFVGASTLDSDADDDVDFADFAFLANESWSYSDLAAFAANWLAGVASQQDVQILSTSHNSIAFPSRID